MNQPASAEEADVAQEASQPTLSAWLGYRFLGIRISGLQVVRSGDWAASDDEGNPLLGDLRADRIFW